MSKKYTVSYRQYIVETNTTISNRGFASISLENIGTDKATINSVIPLNNVGVSRNFEEKPNVIIDSDFIITFQNLDSDKKILVIESYYTEIK